MELPMLAPAFLGIEWLGGLARELALWGGVLLLLAGVLSLYQGWNQRQLASLIDETPRSDIADVRSSGTARVRGEIVPQAERDTFTSPITGDDNCVLSAWEIKEQYDTPEDQQLGTSRLGRSCRPVLPLRRDRKNTRRHR